MLNHLIIGLCLLFSSPVVFAERLVSDPLQDYLGHLPTVFKEDSVIQMTIDLNEDGIKDYFLSSTSRDNDRARYGRTWTTYLSTPQGYQTPESGETGMGEPDAILVFSEGSIVVKYDDKAGGRKVISTFYPGGGGSGVIQGFYVNENNHLKSVELSRVGRNEVLTPITKEEAKGKILENEYQIDRFPLKEVMSAEQYQKLGNKADDFIEKYHVRPDFLDKDIVYVYEKSPRVMGEVPKYTIAGLREKGILNLIPLEVMPERIRAIVMKRGNPRIAKNRLDTKEEIAELALLQKWSAAWHEKFGTVERSNRLKGIQRKAGSPSESNSSELIEPVKGSVVLSEGQFGAYKVFDPDLGQEKQGSILSAENVKWVIVAGVAITAALAMAAMLIIARKRKLGRTL